MKKNNFQRNFYYLVSVLELNGETHVARGAVKESVASADPAYTAAVAVILILVVVVEEIALEASVLAETAVTVLASRLDRLTRVAQDAYQLRHFLSVDRVGLLLVVTETTGVHLVATGGLQSIKSNEINVNNNLTLIIIMILLINNNNFGLSLLQ